jgi:hypothetical protein
MACVVTYDPISRNLKAVICFLHAKSMSAAEINYEFCVVYSLCLSVCVCVCVRASCVRFFLFFFFFFLQFESAIRIYIL